MHIHNAGVWIQAPRMLGELSTMNYAETLPRIEDEPESISIFLYFNVFLLEYGLNDIECHPKRMALPSGDK